MNYAIFDIETDGLYSTKIHCVSVNRVKDGVSTRFTITDYAEMREFFTGDEDETLIGHNIVRFDIPESDRVLGISIKKRLIDTLGLSWYLFPLLHEHGLESWGEYYGVPKPQINDWNNLSIEEYIHRCEQDVQINTLLFNQQVAYLKAIYGQAGIDRIMRYITFKLECAREQEQMRWKIDVETCKLNLLSLEVEEANRIDALKAAIPNNILYKKAKRPKNPYKKDGTPSTAGERWFSLLEELGLPPEYNQEIKVVAGEEPGNPTSFTQLKRWLDSLGWVPQTFKFAKDKDHNITRKIPQIANTDGSGLCESVKRLIEVEPALENLEGLFVVRHRMGLLKGFLRDMDSEGFVKAQINGFTNTMRFQHKTVVNLPTVTKPYGDKIRGCLIAPDENHILCGSDMSSLEDNTKQHYMFFFDPEYVKEMRVPGFDPHLDIAIQGGMLTPEQVQAHKDGTENHSKVRKDAKVVNFSAVYGVGAKKMSLTTGWPLSKSKGLLDIYWKRNWSVKKVAAACTVQTINNQMWIYNPVSKFWYTLRFEKDRFSTLNQSTGVYCFDTYVRHVRKAGFKLCGQFHDEIIFPLLKGTQDVARETLHRCIKDVNDELKLNIELGISVDFGDTYAQIH